jgi:hypothetical protein
VKIDFEALRAPFDPNSIHWRVGATTKDKDKGMPLAYIDARDVMERLDEVCGPQNWQCRYSHAGEKTVCELSIRCEGEWITKANGAGDTDYEGEKGALSDAFKRAAVLWGIGQYLYGIQSPWVAIEPKGRSYVVAKHEMPRLFKLVGGKTSGNLKKDGEWEMFKKDVEQATSIVQIENIWRSVQKEGWPQSWLDQAIELCKKRKQDFIDAMPDAEDNHERLEYNV